MTKKALFGILDPNWIEIFQAVGEKRGWDIESVDSLDAMLERVGKSDFQLYVMDANLGERYSFIYEPAKRIYERLRPRIESKQAEFIALSSNDGASESCNREGIPCYMKNIDIIRNHLIK